MKKIILRPKEDLANQAKWEAEKENAFDNEIVDEISRHRKSQNYSERQVRDLESKRGSVGKLYCIKIAKHSIVTPHLVRLTIVLVNNNEGPRTFRVKNMWW